MIRTESEALKERRNSRLLRPSAIVVIALVFAFGIAVPIGWIYSPHLLWRFQENRRGLKSVRAVPNRQMPATAIPNDWVRCRVGQIEFSLPPELASKKVVPKNGASLIMFEHGSRAVAVAVPNDARDFSDLLTTASKLCPRQQKFTLPRLRVECYQVSSDDFRWSMTGDEVRWHAFCVTTSKLIRPKSDGHTESFVGKDLDGFVHFHDNRAVFDWQGKDQSLSGYMHFYDKSDNADSTWIRAVCQSLKFVK